MAPKVSVIIPNYNHARYLPQRIESVLQQTEQDIEILLLDDCSTDESLPIIMRYAKRDKRIRVVINQENSGNTFAQWNKGVSLATGEYIWIAESDDYADPQLLEQLCRTLDTNPQVGLAFCDSWHVDEYGQQTALHTASSEEFASSSWREDFVCSGSDFTQDMLSVGNAIPNASAVLLRSSVLRKVGLAETTFKLSGDWVYWIRVLAQCDVAFVAQPMNFFRQHVQNVRSRTGPAKTLLEGAKMIRKLRKHLHLGTRFEERRVRQILRSCFYGMLYENMKLTSLKKVLSILNKTLPNFTGVFFQEGLHILFSNKMSGLRQLVGDGLLYKALPRAKEDTLIYYPR
jgi:glycosyltransferase involved in cell wall biosynthesis